MQIAFSLWVLQLSKMCVMSVELTNLYTVQLFQLVTHTVLRRMPQWPLASKEELVLHHVIVTTVHETVTIAEHVTHVVGTSAADFDPVQQWHEATALGQDVGDCRLWHDSGRRDHTAQNAQTEPVSTPAAVWGSERWSYKGNDLFFLLLRWKL